MPGYERDDSKSLSNLEYALAGGASGGVTRFFCQPFDVLKIRFQLQVEPISKNSLSSKYNAVYQALKTILIEEGIFGLWKGHNAGQLLSITYGLVQFQTFEFFTKTSSTVLNLDPTASDVHFLCGSLSGVAATMASFPFDVAKTRFIAQGNDRLYNSMFHAFKTMLKDEGVVSLFRGLTPGILLVAPQTGAMFTVHNMLKKLFRDANLMPNNVPTLGQNLFIGSMAGLISKTLVYPMDLSRKRLQLQGFRGRKGFGEVSYQFSFLLPKIN
ncbi:unnamed protein product [Nezara viridula]|uniref:Mitochondrial thiamine pyrophosphate carrier n=1 Tax=Nezara viridula TaxID=85310 RepID=A0A9P0HAU6_NEZVI|nr:unnamed protein product [Nezara viridula]